MPSSGNTSADRFYVGLNGGGGIPEAEKAITDAGGYVSVDGYISYDGEDVAALEAVCFLCYEWRYVWA